MKTNFVMNIQTNELTLASELVVFTHFNFTACERVKPEIKKHFLVFPPEKDSALYYQVAKIVDHFSPKLMEMIADVEAHLNSMLIKPTTPFDDLTVHSYCPNTSHDADTPYRQDTCTDYTLLLVITDGADIYIRRKRELVKVETNVGACILLQKSMSYEVRNVKRDGCMLVLKIKAL